MVQQEATDQVVVLAVGLLSGVKGPEGGAHERGLLQGVEGVHRGSVGQVESRQLRHAVPGGRVERRLLAVVLVRLVDVGACRERKKEKERK